MRMSRRCMAAIAGAVVLVHVAAVHAQSPSAPTPEAEPSAKKNQPLPKIEVIAPKKKASRPAPPPPTKAAPAPAPTLVDVPSPPPAPAWAGAFEVPMSPTGGSDLPVDKVPAGISVINSTQIERVGSPSITEAINTYVPSATINEALGNGLATDLQYRGFSASPLNGTPQGLAIYQNGVRLNEVFGDAMNWDLIPQIAIADIVMMSNNPAYGLNALGGAVNVIMKDGFRFQGATIDTPLRLVRAQGGCRRGRPEVG